MTLTLELTAEQERQLASEARQQGIDTRTYALAVLTHQDTGFVNSGRNESLQLPKPGSLTPAEIVAYWEREGILRARPDLPDSPIYARQLREAAQNRDRE